MIRYIVVKSLQVRRINLFNLASNKRQRCSSQNPCVFSWLQFLMAWCIVDMRTYLVILMSIALPPLPEVEQCSRVYPGFGQKVDTDWWTAAIQLIQRCVFWLQLESAPRDRWWLLQENKGSKEAAKEEMQQNFLLVHCKDTWKSRDLRYDNTKYMPIDRKHRICSSYTPQKRHITFNDYTRLYNSIHFWSQ